MLAAPLRCPALTAQRVLSCCLPAIVRFLGYNPLPAAKGWAERLVRHRTSLGMTQGEAAGRLGVDPSTLARWERGERQPERGHAVRAEEFLTSTETTSGARIA